MKKLFSYTITEVLVVINAIAVVHYTVQNASQSDNKSTEMTMEEIPSEIFFWKCGKNPFLIDMVLISMFESLDVETLKSCRLVCNLWKEISEFNLKKRSNVSLHWRDADDEEYLENFNRTFPISNKLFTTVKIKLFKMKIKSEILESVLTERKGVFTDLELRNVCLVDENEEIISDYDISFLIPSKLERLCIVNNLNGYTNFMVSPERIIFIESLDLFGCTVIVPRETSFTAKEMTLNRVRFTKQVLLSDFINFSTVNTLDFRDISDKVNLKVRKRVRAPSGVILDVCQANILSSDWISDVLNIRSDDFQNYLCSITELTIRCSIIDISTIPSTIETLHLGPNSRTMCSQPFRFHFLHSLHLTGNLDTLAHFKDCPNLVNLEVSPNYVGPSECNLNDIPVTVTRFKISHDYHGKIEWVGFGDTVLQLNTLIISDCQWHHILHSGLLKAIKTIHFAINIINCRTPSPSQIKNFVEMQENIFSHSFFVGPFHWKEDSQYKFAENFQDSSLSSIVDTKSDYYFFANKTGTAIGEQEFYTKLKLNV